MAINFDFTNKVCVVTGGGNGIGRCLAEEFLKCGANVAIIDSDGESQKRIKVMPNCNGNLIFFNGDMARKSTLIEFEEVVKSEFSTIDFLINNACISNKGILSNCDYEEIENVLRIGAIAPYFLTKLFADSFSKSGSIVNITSTRAQMSQQDTESYSMAKGAISSLTHSLAASLAGNVRVNSIAPGWIDTRDFQSPENLGYKISEADKLQHTVGRVGTPYDIAKMAMYLCSEEASFINAQNFTVDGGMSKLMIYNNDLGWTYSP